MSSARNARMPWTAWLILFRPPAIRPRFSRIVTGIDSGRLDRRPVRWPLEGDDHGPVPQGDDLPRPQDGRLLDELPGPGRPPVPGVHGHEDPAGSGGHPREETGGTLQSRRARGG